MAPTAHSPVVRNLRLVPIVTWPLAFALTVAHGVLSRQPYPSTGIVPQTVAAILAVCVLRLPPEPELAEPESAAEAEAESDAESATLEDSGPTQSPLARALHPSVVFLLDVAVSAVLFWILIQTWLQDSPTSQISMLAAYTTVPMMANILASAGAGLHAIYYGLAINGYVQWVAWRAVPGDCPNCQHSLRPASLPEVPWLRRFKRSGLLVAPVLVDEEHRYRDESDAEAGQPETATATVTATGHAQNEGTPNNKGKAGPMEFTWGESTRSC